MKVRSKILIPVTLGLMMSACSTSSSQQTSSVIVPEVSNTDTSSQSPVVSASNSEFDKGASSKQALIESLQRQLADNERQLSFLNLSLNEKDRAIADLQKSSSNAESLAALEEQKKSRETLESRYAALKLDNDLLTRRINQLENENTSLKRQVSSLESMPTSQDGFKQSYLTLLSENTELQNKYANLEADNKTNQKQLSMLKKENLILGGALSDARAQHQVLWDEIRSLRDNSDQTNTSIQPLDSSTLSETSPVFNYASENTQIRMDLANLQKQVAEQKRVIEEYQSDVLKLESALDEGADYEARWKALDDKLAQAEQDNVSLSSQLNAAGAELAASQAELSALSARLGTTKQMLESKENNDISLAAAIESFQLQLSSTLQNVTWQLPNEIALHNNFEILVSADVQPSLSGQTYQAELVTDSDINMISDRLATAVVQGGRLQWRWRVSGLNEKPVAQLNLFVSQQINFEDQSIQRQVYRGNETLSLINTNLFEKYGYWVGAILLGLLGGFLIGRLNKSKNTL